MSKKRNWRGVSDKVAKDKQEIYNSREWKELTILKKRANPLCEQCIKDGEALGIQGGYIHIVECVHHIIPIETAKTKEEMRRLAFSWNNLMSLCKSCHAKIHKEMGSNTAKIVHARAEARQARWAYNIVNRFLLPAHSDSEYVEYEEIKEENGIQKEVHTGLVREPSAGRTSEAQAQTDSEGNSNNPHGMG